MDETDNNGRRVLVIGGGIGGLAAALALARQGIRVKLLEQAEQIGEIGAGIQLAANVSNLAQASSTSHTAVALLATDMSSAPDSTISSPDTTVTASPLGSGPAPSDTASELVPVGLSASGGIDSSSENTLTSTPAVVLPSASPASVSGSAGIQVDATGDSSTANSTTTAALDASAAFFGFTIDSKCDSDCGEWKTLAGVSGLHQTRLVLPTGRLDR